MSMPNEKAEKLQREGQDAYRKKEFDTALQLFSQALDIPKISPLLQIRILDNRAAAQEKVGGAELLRAALADAKKMIQLQKTSANGYLRAGKILRLQGSDGLALDIYKYGLKRLASNDGEGKRLLEGMHQKVLSRIERPKAAKTLDVMSMLPLELMEMILQYLPFQTLMLAQRVSRSWRQFLSNHHRTYTTVDFSGAKRPVSKYAVKMCVNRSKGNITKLILSRLGFSDSTPLVYLALRCKHLSHVEFLGTDFYSLSLTEMTKTTSNLKTLIVDNLTSISAISTIIDQCTTLECLECSNVEFKNLTFWHRGRKNLQRLLLASNEVSKASRLLQLVTPSLLLSLPRFLSVGGSNPPQPTLLKQLPELRELELVDFPHSLGAGQFDFMIVPDLTLLTLSNISLTRLPLLPPTIVHLDLANNPMLVITPSDILASPLPVLESLSLASNPKLTNTLLLSLLSTHSLRKLILAMCPRLDFETVDWLLDPGHGAQLEELSVVGNSTFGDRVSKELGRLKVLKRLDVACTRISGIGVLNIVRMRQGEGDGGLDRIRCDGCDEVGHDAVAVVRKMGVSVSHRMEAGELRKGRKLRYGD